MKTSKILLTGITLIFLLSTTAATPQPPHEIFGFVKDNKGTVENVKVKAVTSNTTYTDTTDSKGYYRIQIPVKHDKFDIKIKEKVKIEDIQVVSGMIEEYNFTISSNQQEDSGEDDDSGTVIISPPDTDNSTNSKDNSTDTTDSSKKEEQPGDTQKTDSQKENQADDGEPAKDSIHVIASKMNVKPRTGEPPFTVKGKIALENTGDSTTTETVEIKKNNQLIATRTVKLQPGENKTLNYTHTVNQLGSLKFQAENKTETVISTKAPKPPGTKTPLYLTLLLLAILTIPAIIYLTKKHRKQRNN